TTLHAPVLSVNAIKRGQTGRQSELRPLKGTRPERGLCSKGRTGHTHTHTHIHVSSLHLLWCLTEHGDLHISTEPLSSPNVSYEDSQFSLLLPSPTSYPFSPHTHTNTHSSSA